MGAELSHAGGRTDRHNEANSCFSRFFANAPKNDGAVQAGTGRPRNRGSNPGKGFSKASTPAKQPTHTPVQLQSKGLRLRKSGSGVKLTTQLHSTPRLRMCAASGTIVHLSLNTTDHTYLGHYTTKVNHGNFQGRCVSSRIEAAWKLRRIYHKDTPQRNDVKVRLLIVE